MKFSRKGKIFIILFTLFIIVLWISVFKIRTSMLAKEYEAPLSENFIKELNGISVQDVQVHTEDNKTIGLQDVLDTDIKSGDIVDVSIEYDDGTKADKQAYVSVNTDEDEVLVRYTDGTYGQIKLPAKDVMTPKEFKEKLIEENKQE